MCLKHVVIACLKRRLLKRLLDHPANSRRPGSSRPARGARPPRFASSGRVAFPQGVLEARAHRHKQMLESIRPAYIGFSNMLGRCSQMLGLCRQLCIIFPSFAEQTLLNISVLFMGMGFSRPPISLLLGAEGGRRRARRAGHGTARRDARRDARRAR